MFLTITTPRVAPEAGLAAKVRHGFTLMREVLGAILFGPMRIVDNHRMLTSLSEMSDHQLADVGLTRQDIFDSAALPLLSEPSAFLAARVSERRRRP